MHTQRWFIFATAFFTTIAYPAASKQIAPFVSAGELNKVLNIRVTNGSDDAEEESDGHMYRGSSDLELVFDDSNQMVGLRFNRVEIPQGATITDTFVQFKTDEKSRRDASLTIQGEAIDNAPTFTSSNSNISSRRRTTAAVPWSPQAWRKVGKSGPKQQTPNLAAIIQEIVDRPGWSSGNSLVIIITGSGKRIAESYEGWPAGAPLLHVEYNVNNQDPDNQAPLAQDDNDTTFEDIPVITAVLANDSDVDGDLLMITKVTQPSRGSSEINPDETITYTPDVNINGTDRYTYRVCDNGAPPLCDTAAVTITVDPVTSPPVTTAGAFPGAEGFGAKATGGRGGRVIEVSNLNDSGPGSLRAALLATGPRIIVFRTGGTIVIKSDIELRADNSNVTVAGQTAPGGGITLRNDKDLMKNASIQLGRDVENVIIRYMRFRPGPHTQSSSNMKALNTLGKNIIVDHCSFSWATDETINTWYDARDITFQWNIISEGLDLTDIASGQCPACGPLFGDRSLNVSYHHNLTAHMNKRGPRVSGGYVDIVNNVNYNSRSTPVRFDNNADYVGIAANFVGNYFKVGSDYRWSSGVEVKIRDNSAGAVGVFLQGNIGPNRRSDTGPEDVIVDDESKAYLMGQRYDYPPITTTSAFRAYDNVLAQAGANAALGCDGTWYPRRDAVDQRVVDDVRNGTGSLIVDPSEVGGWPVLDAGTPCADRDHDGMPDVWEHRHGFDPDVPTDGPHDADRDGYTNLEEFLNGFTN